MDPIIPPLPLQRICVEANKVVNVVLGIFHRIDFFKYDRQTRHPGGHLQMEMMTRGHGGKNFFFVSEGVVSILCKEKSRDDRRAAKLLAAAGVEHLEVIVDKLPKFAPTKFDQIIVMHCGSRGPPSLAAEVIV